MTASRRIGRIVESVAGLGGQLAEGRGLAGEGGAAGAETGDGHMTVRMKLNGAEDRGASDCLLHLGPAASPLLVLVAAYHGMTPRDWVTQMIGREARAIGIANLARPGMAAEPGDGEKRT